MMRDCHYCKYAVCKSKDSEVIDCYVRDGSRFDHHIDSADEAEYCDEFLQDNHFPKN